MLYFTCTCVLVVSMNDDDRPACNYMYSMFFGRGVAELFWILPQSAQYMYTCTILYRAFHFPKFHSTQRSVVNKNSRSAKQV